MKERDFFEEKYKEAADQQSKLRLEAGVLSAKLEVRKARVRGGCCRADVHAREGTLARALAHSLTHSLLIHSPARPTAHSVTHSH